MITGFLRLQDRRLRCTKLAYMYKLKKISYKYLIKKISCAMI
ncbi:hypothetical protein HMPREF3201_01876 [Megasphaera sp. MJR8396C]|nr:hypothetical protein HMPREF3201_01876 [Megasphaera sp. MJR8396C]